MIIINDPYAAVLSYKSFLVHSRIIQKQDHFSVFTIIWRLHFCRTFSIIVICIQDFLVKKVSHFSNFICTTILAKAPGLLSCPGYCCFSHFFSVIFKKSYSYHLLWPLSTFSFFSLFGKTFRRQSFKKISTFIHISYVL